MKWVNQFHYGYDELPFGGIKAVRLRQGARYGGARLATSRIKSVVIGGLE